jgi:ribosomal protein L40E
MDYHPHKTDPEAYLWSRNINRGTKDKLTMRYVNAMMLIRRLAEKAGIKKRVNPHAFRHSRATVLANKLTEAQMKEYFGWVQGSDMASVYVHLSGRDVDNAILGAYGLKNEENKELEKFRPVVCGRCSSTNSPGSKFCTKCGYALSVDVVLNNEQPKEPAVKGDLMAFLMKDPEFKKLIMKRLMEVESPGNSIKDNSIK